MILRKRSFATLLTSAVFIFMSGVIALVFLQNYQVTKHFSEQEAKRATIQTSRLVQNTFNAAINSITIQQNGFSRDETLSELVKNRDMHGIDLFFIKVDQLEHHTVLSRRYITVGDDIFWGGTWFNTRWNEPK